MNSPHHCESIKLPFYSILFYSKIPYGDSNFLLPLNHPFHRKMLSSGAMIAIIKSITFEKEIKYKYGKVTWQKADVNE